LASARLGATVLDPDRCPTRGAGLPGSAGSPGSAVKSPLSRRGGEPAASFEATTYSDLEFARGAISAATVDLLLVLVLHLVLTGRGTDAPRAAHFRFAIVTRLASVPEAATPALFSTTIDVGFLAVFYEVEAGVGLARW